MLVGIKVKKYFILFFIYFYFFILFFNQWWNSLWITQGMKHFLPYLIVGELYPNWEIWRDFHNLQNKALFSDSLINSHPLELPENNLTNTDQLESIFDEITNFKSASVLLMLYDQVENIEPFVFQKSLQKFLKNYAYSSFDTDDFSQLLSEVSVFCFFLFFYFYFIFYFFIFLFLILNFYFIFLIIF